MLTSTSIPRRPTWHSHHVLCDACISPPTFTYRTRRRMGQRAARRSTTWRHHQLPPCLSVWHRRKEECGRQSPRKERGSISLQAPWEKTKQGKSLFLLAENVSRCCGEREVWSKMQSDCAVCCDLARARLEIAMNTDRYPEFVRRDLYERRWNTIGAGC